MRVAVFSTKSYDRISLNAANKEGRQEFAYLEPHLNLETSVLAKGFEAVCVFVNDIVDAAVLKALHAGGTRLIALRCAGFNNVDLTAAKKLGITVARVPAYSPYAVAEHALALMLTLNRKTHRAYNRTREGNFSIEGLLGFDFHGRTAGVVGTGKIGVLVGRLLQAMGCKVLAFDPYPSPEAEKMGMDYRSLPDLLGACDIVTLHCPLTPETHHLINTKTIAQMKDGVMLINTGRGALIEAPALLDALKSGKIGYLGLDVYEEEGDLFFDDHSSHVIKDDVLMRLMSFPNVLVTSHQAFFTYEALTKIAEVTVSNITSFQDQKGELHRVTAE